MQVWSLSLWPSDQSQRKHAWTLSLCCLRSSFSDQWSLEETCWVKGWSTFLTVPWESSYLWTIASAVVKFLILFVLTNRCPPRTLMVTAGSRPISGSCVLPALPATSSSTSEMSVFSTCQPKTTSQSHLPWLVMSTELCPPLYIVIKTWHIQIVEIAAINQEILIHFNHTLCVKGFICASVRCKRMRQVEYNKQVRSNQPLPSTLIFLVKESRGAAIPVPVPQRVKNRLIALCKDVAFTVRCSLCHKVLISHQAAQAHFK